MKKLLVVLLVALLAVALVACGGNDETTPKATTPGTTPESTPAGGADTTPSVPDSSSTAATTGGDVTTETPVTAEGIDILNNLDDLNCNVIQADYNNGSAFDFEDFHVDLNYQVALVIKFIENRADFYEDLVYTNDDGTYEFNPEYKWVVTIDGERIEVLQKTAANRTTSGWVRLALGEDFSFDKFEYDADGIHMLDVRLDIYNSMGKVEYYAYLTDPEWNDLYPLEKPTPLQMVPDKNRPADVVAVDTAVIKPINGPVGGLEVYQNAFDGKVRTKFYTTIDGEEGAVDVQFTTSVPYLLGISIVNGNDNETYAGRTLTDFEIYVSTTGNENDWKLAQAFSNKDADGNNIVDKNTIKGNYQERYYAFNAAAQAMLTDVTYIRIVPRNGEPFQASEIIFYTSK